MIIQINPLHMSNIKHGVLLRELFNSNKLCLVWKKEHTYPLPQQQVELTHTIILKQSADGKMDYHVLSDTVLGRGSFGVVFEIACTFSFPNEMTADRSVSTTQPCVVKILSIKSNKHSKVYESQEEFESRVNKEYHASHVAAHLMMERPIFYAERAFLLMRKLPGVELFKLVESMLIYEKMTWQFLFQLTLALLDAFQQQVVIHQISHRDLKLENILVDIGTGNIIPNDFTRCNVEYMDVNLLDYCFSLPYGTVAPMLQGTPLYIAHEVQNGYVSYDEKVDLFAIGIILKILWGFSYDDDIRSLNLCVIQRSAGVYELIKSSSPDFSFGIYMKICDVVMAMCHYNPDVRYSLQKSINAFHAISHPLYSQIQTYFEQTQMLISADSSVLNQTNGEGFTRLHIASQFGYLKTVHALIAAGADLNIRVALSGTVKLSNMTALEIAFAYGRDAIAMSLFEAGAEISLNNKKKLIQFSVYNYRFQYLQILLQQDPSLIDTKSILDEGLLETAVRRGHYELVAFLIQKGGDLNQSIVKRGHLQDNTLLLDWAICHSDHFLIRLLMDAGAKTSHIPNKINNKTVKDLIRNDELHLLQCLMALNPALIHQATEDGRTPLQLAVIYDTNIETIRYLLEMGAKINDPTPTDARQYYPNKTPIEIAKIQGNNKIVTLLLKSGASFPRPSHEEEKVSQPIASLSNDSRPLQLLADEAHSEEKRNAEPQQSTSQPQDNAIKPVRGCYASFLRFFCCIKSTNSTVSAHSTTHSQTINRSQLNNNTTIIAETYNRVRL
jgi:ankyrin repeat protein